MIWYRSVQSQVHVSQVGRGLALCVGTAVSLQVWKAINDWVKNHRPPLNFRKIIAILIINQSASGIQVRGSRSASS